MDELRRKFETATCHINDDWQEVPWEVRKETWFISNVHSTIKRARHATGLMEMVISEANRKQKMLVLEPRAYKDGMTDNELKQWYERLGFEQFQKKWGARPCLMLKKPDCRK